MLTFLKNLLGGRKQSTCCGGGCQSSAPASVDLGLPEADMAALKQVPESVVVGKILAIRAHKSEKMTKVRVTECDLGNGEKEQILCGGANIAEGQIVPVAKLGTDLGEGFVIGERDIRGEVSRGMICARQEIGLTEIESEKGGIWVMPAEFESKLGMSVKDL